MLALPDEFKRTTTFQKTLETAQDRWPTLANPSIDVAARFEVVMSNLQANDTTLGRGFGFERRNLKSYARGEPTFQSD